MGFCLCPSSLACLSAGLLLAKVLVSPPHPTPLILGISGLMNGLDLAELLSTHLKGDFPVGGKRVDSRRERRRNGGRERRRRGEEEGSGLHFV